MAAQVLVRLNEIQCILIWLQVRFDACHRRTAKTVAKAGKYFHLCRPLAGVGILAGQLWSEGRRCPQTVEHKLFSWQSSNPLYSRRAPACQATGVLRRLRNIWEREQ